MFTRLRGITLLACLVSSLATGSAEGQLINNTFTGAGGDCFCSGDWNQSGNWTGPVPNSTHNVIIPPGKQAQICGDELCIAANAGAIQVDGMIEMYQGVSLTIHEDGGTSVVNGTVNVMKGSLVIANDHTIDGRGAIVLFTFQNYTNTIQGAGKLTLEHDCHSEIADFCAVKVWGKGEISVRLENNAIVSAGNCQTGGGGSATLRLTNQNKDGTGIWMAECGILSVECTVTGSGLWLIPELGEVVSATRIDIKTATSVTGEVTLQCGTLKVEQNFCTTGKLTWESTDADGLFSEVTIQTATNKRASFGGSCWQ